MRHHGTRSQLEFLLESRLGSLNAWLPAVVQEVSLVCGVERVAVVLS
jgi:hypothetical protein